MLRKIKDFGKKILTFLNNEIMREKLSKFARIFASKHSWELVAERELSIILHLLEKGRK